MTLNSCRYIVRLTATLVCLAALAGCGAPSGVLVSASTYNFGTVVVGAQAASPAAGNRTVVTVENTALGAAQITMSVSGDPTITLQPTYSCPATLPFETHCIVVVNYSPIAAGTNTASLTVTSVSVTGLKKSYTVALSGTAVNLQPGGSLITASANPQVAQYTWYPSAPGKVYASFGPTTAYGRNTSLVTASGSQPVSMLIAGMAANTAYHMTATLVPDSGQAQVDVDHTFTPGSFAQDVLPTVKATTDPGQTPQPGVELVNTTVATPAASIPLYATNLNGTLIWSYPLRDHDAGTILQGARLIPNGDLLVQLSLASQDFLSTKVPANTVNVIREIDLAGNLVREISITQLNAKLAAAGASFSDLLGFNHEITVLPNGHIMVLANHFKLYTGLTGYTKPVNVLGDVVVDMDQNFNPVWTWDSFNYLDVNRHPIGFPDWTHFNTILYSPTDGNLYVSSRHQAWILKIQYQNGSGNGALLWKLGYQGDFTLVNGTAPEDWQYGQHYISLVNPAISSGTFQMTMIDNGFGRFYANGTQCTAQAANGICYTTVPIYTINESAMTCTVAFRDTLPTAMYSFFGGATETQANGDLEFALSAQPDGNSAVYEIIPNSAQTPVWNLDVTGSYAYRSFRLPSLYYGVQWTQ